MIFAHHDGYFEAAFDNATGSATMIGLAEYFAKIPQAQRKRTIKFVSTAAHHAGSPGTRWMYDNLSGAMSKTVLVINCEHTSITQQYLQGPDLRRSNAINAERWWVNGSDKLASVTLDAVQDVRRVGARRHGAGRERRHGPDRARRAVDSVDHLAVLLPLRSRSRIRRAGSRTRARRTRLREDHRSGQHDGPGRAEG